jgi:hypothetical protein
MMLDMKSVIVTPLVLVCLFVAAASAYPETLVQNDCFVWYCENITATVRVYKPDAKKEIPATPSETIHVLPKVKPSDVRTQCTDPKSKSLSLTFSSPSNQRIVLKLVVRVRSRHHWQLDESSSRVQVEDGGKTFDFNVTRSEVSAGDTFSFSCSRLRLKSGRATLKYPQRLDLVISRFQLQPFKGSEKRVFADSFDCATWFTIPLWTGFLVTLLFTAILSFGVYALLGIKTPDRFENPKGKTITVTATD